MKMRKMGGLEDVDGCGSYGDYYRGNCRRSYILKLVFKIKKKIQILMADFTLGGHFQDVL